MTVGAKVQEGITVSSPATTPTATSREVANGLLIQPSKDDAN